MKNCIAKIFLAVLISSCTTAPKTSGYSYNVDRFAGLWVMVNGPQKGLQYKAIAAGRKLILSPLSDTDCLRINEQAFIGKIEGNQIRGQTTVCLAGGTQSTREMVLLIKDINTLIAANTPFAHVYFPGIQFARDIFLTQ